MLEQHTLEENRAKAVILAGNPQLYGKLWPEAEDTDIQWETPQSEEDIQDMIKEFESGTVYER